MPVVRYESVRDFEKDLPAKYPRHESDTSRWIGGLTYRQSRKGVYTGDESALARSTKILDQVEADGIELLSPQWEYDRTGAIPCIPSFLAGSPESMRRLDYVGSETAPIKIYVDLFISCGFTVEELTQRGAMLLALARKLQAVRPVELWLLMSAGSPNEKDDWLSPMIKLETNPLDLTQASFVLGHPGFVRQLCFSWCVARGVPSEIPFFEYAKSRVKPEPQDLFIENAIFSRDVLNNPVAWVNAQVKKYSGALAEESA